MIDIRTVEVTGSTNVDLLSSQLVGEVSEGFWLRAERQSAGRGRQGRLWVSPPGNFYGSTAVRLRPGDPPAPTLGFVAAVALAEVVADQLTSAPMLKWPNDLLIGNAKLSGILLERAADTVVVGVGVNLAHHPALPDRRTTSMAAQGVEVDPGLFAMLLADSFAAWLLRWRTEGFAPVRSAWLGRAHQPGTRLRATLPDDKAVEGLFEDLDAGGALILRLASGERRAIHAGDVFLV